MVVARSHHRSFLFLLVVLCLAFAPNALAQQADKKPAPNRQKPARAKTPPDLSEWKSMLDDLAVDARALDAEQDPALLLAEVADTYWRFDAARSRTLFTEAFERSLLPPSSGSTVRMILALAAQHDRDLVVSFGNRLLDFRKNTNEPVSESLTVAHDLLDTNKALAVEMAQTAISLGPSMSGMTFLFKLARQDPAAADQLYSAYLKQLSTLPKPPLSSVLWLGGYPFGYEEAYGDANDSSDLIGFGTLRTETKLRPNPTLAAAYLQLAFVSVINTLKEAAATSDENARDELNALALFTTSYLSDEVFCYQGFADGAWASLWRNARVATSRSRNIAVQARVQTIIAARSRPAKSSEEDVETQISDQSEVVDKIQEGCPRDEAYGELALELSHTNKFKRAREAADKIENVSLRENVLQFMNGDLALAAIYAGNLTEASSMAEKVTAKDQRALLLVKTAVRLLLQGDESGTLNLLQRAQSLVSDSEPELQSSALLAIAGVYLQFKPAAAALVLRSAIKAFNRLNKPNIYPFSVLRRIDLSCPRAGRWRESNEVAGTAGLYETLAAIANSDIGPQEALLIASEFENKPLRLRSQLSIVKAVRVAT
jgi:hypothetical protein